MSFLNPWSLANKTTAIKDFLLSNDPDLMAIAESWLQSDQDESKPQYINQHEMLPADYQMIYVPRPEGKRGGGIAVIFRNSVNVKVVSFSKLKTSQFEYIVCSVTICKLVLRLIVVYRPDPTAVNGLNVNLFWKQFEDVLCRHAVCTEEVIITGDLNFHLDNVLNTNTKQLHSILDGLGLEQKVNEPTHVAGHILDVLIMRTESTILKDVQVRDPCLINEQGKLIKDHFAVHWTLDIDKPEPLVKKIQYRDVRNIDYNKLSEELIKTDLFKISIDDQHTVTDTVDLYNDTLQFMLDKFAPIKEKTVVIRDNTQWYTNEITSSKRLRRQAERRFTRTRTEEDHELYRQQCNRTNWLLRKAKREFYSAQIQSANRDQKTIFKLSNSWMGLNKNVLPSHECDQTLANEMSQFFVEKSTKIHQELKESLHPMNPYIQVQSTLDTVPTNKLQEYKLVTVRETKEIVMAAPCKFCNLDPFPTAGVKKLINCLASPITVIINKSLSSGYVPTSMKKALVRPGLKDSSLDPEMNSSYRPVSNLSFLSKVMERVVNNQLDEHLEANSLLDDSQSAYRQHHSTETLLIKVQSDILDALDRGYATILVMLDISAAFDVVDHKRLLERHEKLFGISGNALEWLASYLDGRTQCVVIGNKQSDFVNIEFGFPQGSVLGGKKFVMYSTPLGRVIIHHDVEQKRYADDTQKYLSFCLKDPAALESAINQMQLLFGDVQLWMSANMLKLNNGKTKLIVFAPKRHLQRLNGLSIKVDGAVIYPKQEVTNLGVIFDTTLSMLQQVNLVTKKCYFHIRRIWKIRKYLTEDATKSLVNAYVVSRLDYCNSTFSELPDYLIKKLQRVQNRAARLVKKLPWCSRITRHLRELHWLPIRERIQFKVLLIVYKSLNNLSPRYLQDMFQYYNPSRTLRSSSKRLLVVKRTRTRYGARALANCGPKMWNQLPMCIRTADTILQFKSLLKTHLFNNYYSRTGL